jgi:hypothetical protein
MIGFGAKKWGAGRGLRPEANARRRPMKMCDELHGCHALGAILIKSVLGLDARVTLNGAGGFYIFILIINVLQC